MVVTAPKLKLLDGYQMPALGLGTYLTTGNDVEKSVKLAIDAGYRHIDTAYLYQNEGEVGKAVRDKISEGVITREDVFIVTKLWDTFHDETLVEHACRKSLKNLGLEYIDLYLMHFPIGYVYQGDDVLFPKDADGNELTNDIDYLETWRGMEKCVRLGLVRSIGVSNFSIGQITRVLEVAEIKPVNNQVEISPSMTQKRMIKFCKENGIVVTAYSPFGRPSTADRVQDFFTDQGIADIGKKYNKTRAQVILRYIYELGAVVIPKSVNKSRIEENINIFDFELSKDDTNYMETFNKPPTLDMSPLANHKYYPFNEEYLYQMGTTKS